MTRNFVLTSIAVTCILLQITHAASFECAEEPAVCKTKFAKQFENDFRNLHLDAINKFMTKFTEIGNTIKSELPADTFLAKYIEERINMVNNALEKMHGNFGDIKKFTESFASGMTAMDTNIMNTLAHEFQRLLDKHDYTNTHVSILRKLGADTGDLWAEMYKGLRETDLKAYPEYAEVNVVMETLRGNGGRPADGSDFGQAIDILGTEFNLPYFTEIKYLS